jgi:hypothetical protein
MNEAYCIALVFSRAELRYQAYAYYYVSCLLQLNKRVVILSPFGLDFQEQLRLKNGRYLDKLSILPISSLEQSSIFPSHFGLIRRVYLLRNQLARIQQINKTKIDLVFFAPIEDWVKPKFKKWLFKKILPYPFSGLMMQTSDYELGKLKLNVDPKYKEPDYLLSSENCVGICTIDRFNTEKIRSRVYRKVIVMPDISISDFPKTYFDYEGLLIRMAKGRLICGLILESNARFPRSFIELILAAPEESYFFVLAGQLNLSQITEADKQLMENLLEYHTQKFFLLKDIENSHEHMNYLIGSLDVLYIDQVDKDLPSILLTKAASLNKPVICTRNGQTSKLVSAFKLGQVVSNNKANQLEAINLYRLQMPLILKFNNMPQEHYTQLQNDEALRQSWEELLWF